MGAVLAPRRFAVLERDVVHRAETDALTAADAFAARCKGVRLNKKRVEDWVHGTAYEAIVEVAARRGKVSFSPNGGDGVLNTRLGIGYNFSRFVRLRRVEHGDVVFRHNDLSGSPICKAFRLTEFTVEFGGVADLAAAGHDEPCLPGIRKIGFEQPIAHNARDTPGVGGGDDDEPFPAGNSGGVAHLDALVHAQKRIAQRVRDTFGDVFAVAGSRKVKYHRVLLYQMMMPSQWSISC